LKKAIYWLHLLKNAKKANYNIRSAIKFFADMRASPQASKKFIASLNTVSVNRLEKVNSLLEREIGKIIQREIFFPDGVLPTLARVETTSNLIEAKVFITVWPEDKSEQVIKTLNKEIYDIQQEINKKLNMRPVPKIRFVKDEIISKAGKIEELLNQLKKDEK